MNWLGSAKKDLSRLDDLRIPPVYNLNLTSPALLKPTNLNKTNGNKYLSNRVSSAKYPSNKPLAVHKLRPASAAVLQNASQLVERCPSTELIVEEVDNNWQSSTASQIDHVSHNILQRDQRAACLPDAPPASDAENSSDEEEDQEGIEPAQLQQSIIDISLPSAVDVPASSSYPHGPNDQSIETHITSTENMPVSPSDLKPPSLDNRNNTNTKIRLKSGHRLSTAFSCGQLVPKLKPETSDSTLTRRHTDGELIKPRVPSASIAGRSRRTNKQFGSRNRSPTDEAGGIFSSLELLPEDDVDDQEETMVSKLSHLANTSVVLENQVRNCETRNATTSGRKSSLNRNISDSSIQSNGSNLSVTSCSIRLGISANSRGSLTDLPSSVSKDRVSSARKTRTTHDSGLPRTALSKRPSSGILLRTQSGSQLRQSPNSSARGKKSGELLKSRVSSAGNLRVAFKSTPQEEEEKRQCDGSLVVERLVNNFLDASSATVEPAGGVLNPVSEDCSGMRSGTVFDETIEEELEAHADEVEKSNPQLISKSSHTNKKNSKSSRRNSIVKQASDLSFKSGIKKRHSQMSMDKSGDPCEINEEDNDVAEGDNEELLSFAGQEEKSDSTKIDSKELKKKRKSSSVSRSARYGQPVHIFTKPVVDKEYECEGFEECKEIHEKFKAKGIEIDFEKIKRALLQPGEGRIELYEMNQVALPSCTTSSLLSHPSTWFPREWARLEEARRLNEKMQEAYLLAHSHHRADDSDDDHDSTSKSRVSSGARPVMEAARTSFVNPDALYSAFARTSTTGINSGPASRVSSAVNKLKKGKKIRPSTAAPEQIVKRDPMSGIFDQILIDGQPAANFIDQEAAPVATPPSTNLVESRQNYWDTATNLFS